MVEFAQRWSKCAAGPLNWGRLLFTGTRTHAEYESFTAGTQLVDQRGLDQLHFPCASGIITELLTARRHNEMAVREDEMTGDRACRNCGDELPSKPHPPGSGTPFCALDEPLREIQLA
jgi:hypothetical protein